MAAAVLLLVLIFIYYKAHSDAYSERLSPSLKFPPRLELLHCHQRNCHRQRPVASRRVASFPCPRILPGPKLCVLKSKSVEHEVGWWTHIREVHFNGHTHFSKLRDREERLNNSFLGTDALQTWYEQMNIIYATEPWRLIPTWNKEATIWKMDTTLLKR